MTRTLAAVDAELPEALWAELDALTPNPSAWLDSNPPITLADLTG